MKSFFLLQAWSLALIFASIVRAMAIDPRNTSIPIFEESETLCIALGTCPGDNPPPASLLTTTPSLPSPTIVPPLAKSTGSLFIDSSAPILVPPSTTTPANAARPTTSSSRRPNPTLSIQNKAMRPLLYSCNKKQMAIVKQAWSEAGKIADAHVKWDPPRFFSSSSYHAAMSMYLGSDSKDDKKWLGTPPLKSNILRQQDIHTDSREWSPWWSYAYIYCDESQVPNKPNKPKKAQCSRPRYPERKVTAYTFPDDGTVFGWNAKYVVLCLRFFEDDVLSLADQVAAARKNVTLQKVIDPWRKVKARIIFHETYHWSPEVSKPRCDRKREVYDPAEIVQIAKEENVTGTKLNAESWTLAAMAIYVQQTFNLKSPPVPQSKATADVQSLLGNNKFSDDLEELFLDQAPDWFLPPVPTTASDFSPNLTNVEQILPDLPFLSYS